MKTFRKLALASATASLIILTPLTLHAEDKAVSQQLTEARQEGSVWTALALNRHLNPFTIDVDVDSGTAVLTGSVESSVDRDLAEQVALGIKGIERVDNNLTVDAEVGRSETRSDLSQRFEDATLTAIIKSKLLWNSNTAGLDISVTTEKGVVTLTGVAETDASRDLAGRLANNTDNVRKVDNRIEVTKSPGTASKAQQSASDAGETVSDAWITSKVKSSLLLDRNLSGLNIHVETNGGVVALSGEVGSSTEKDLAVETAKNIRNVTNVQADQLTIVAGK